MATIAEEIHTLLERLPERDQERVLAYVRELTQKAPFPRTPLPPGTPGSLIARLSVSPEVGEDLARALEETERIDPDGWR
jgi:hypothetical protein